MKDNGKKLRTRSSPEGLQGKVETQLVLGFSYDAHCSSTLFCGDWIALFDLSSAFILW